MNKENPKKNKKSFEYYIAQRKEEFRCQYDHERSWENLQYKLQKRKNHRHSGTNPQIYRWYMEVSCQL